MYEKILARSFSKHEQRKLRYAAFITFLVMLASVGSVLKPYLGSLPLLNIGMSMDSGLRMLITQDARMSQSKENITAEIDDFRPAENVTVTRDRQAENTIMVPEDVEQGEASSVVKSEVSCNFTMPRSNTCTVTGDVRVSGISGTILVPQTESISSGGNKNYSESWKLKPYARKTDNAAMIHVREWSIKSVSEPQELPKCTVTHSVPAIIFSNRGYNGNHFHDFTDTLIPLFLSAKKFDGEVKFLITNYRDFWPNKYKKILKKMSKYEIIDIDKESNTHCFPEVILGLTSQKEFDVDPSMPPYSSIKDFTSFMRETFSLPRSNAINLRREDSPKPRLMIISRKWTRKLMNTGNVVKMAEKMGYEVIVEEGGNTNTLAGFAESMNSCDVLLGVHGAGLTNIVFLPENAVFIQIIPLGTETISEVDFGLPAQDMNLKYMAYKVTKEESSLLQQYPANDIVFKDPDSFRKQNWQAFRAIFLDKQDIIVDVRRLQPLLVKAMQFLHQ